MKEKIAKWYMQGLWTYKMVQDAVKKGKLTYDEVEEIATVSAQAKQAAQKWAYYAAEVTTEKTEKLTSLIASAKQVIREQYPDE